MQKSEGLKIYSYTKPHYKLFREEEFGTVVQVLFRWGSFKVLLRSGSAFQSIIKNF